MPESVKTKAKPRGASRKGIPNKVTKELKDMILGALDDAGGQAYLSAQAIENPAAFLSLIGKVLPKDVNHGGQPENPLTVSVSNSKSWLSEILANVASK